MAFQHFYSRVPARLSMYERTDSFDTFIKSEILDEKYIKDNLLPFCNIKLSTNELNLIRDDKFNVTYAQYTTKNGEGLIQSAISYIPMDFTGERSSYLVHSLIYTEEEKQKIVSSNKYGLINKKLFKTSLDEFNITSKDAKPNESYEEQIWSGDKFDRLEQYVTKYSPVVLKRFIYALLQSVTPKGKNVYLTLSTDMKSLSEEALKIINSISQIFPYNIRNKLSFITFVCEPKRYENLIKIKVMPREYMNIQIGKSYQFDMTTKLIDGIRDEEYKVYEIQIDFLYELLSDDKTREKFLNFYANIVALNPKLNNLDLKEFANIVLLFRQSCDKYDEKFVIPEDKDVYNLLCVYESYRPYLKDKDKCEILKCIQRYATKRIIIPQNIFAKVTKLYQTEEVRCKTTVMSIILDLIHTDVMRDKLFAFIKSNYSKETQKNRSIISEDLSRVFYGGFLQPQIIGLFNQYFDSEVSSTKSIILDRLLLAIRTQGIQDKILEFLDNFYEIFTLNQRDRIYKTFYEMLPENDNLSKKIISFIDSHFDKEANSYKKKIDTNITLLVEEDEKKKSRLLLSLILANKGYLEKIILNKIFTIWSNKGPFNRYLESFNDLNTTEITDNIVKIWVSGYQMTPQIEKKIFDKVIESLNNQRGLKLYNIIDMDEKIKSTLINIDYYKINEIPDDLFTRIEEFYQKLKRQFINDFIKDHLLDCFNLKLRRDGIDYIVKYAEDNSYIKESDNYLYVNSLKNVIDKLSTNEIEESLKIILNENYSKSVLKSMLEPFNLIINDLEDKSYTSFEGYNLAICIAGIKNYLENGFINLEGLYIYSVEKRKNFLIANRNSIKELSKGDVNFDSHAAMWSYEQILKYLEIVFSVTNIPDKTTIYNNEENGISKVVEMVLSKLDKNDNKKFTLLNSSYKVLDSKLIESVDLATEKYNNENKKGFFARLFGKK